MSNSFVLEEDFKDVISYRLVITGESTVEVYVSNQLNFIKWIETFNDLKPKPSGMPEGYLTIFSANFVQLSSKSLYIVGGYKDNRCSFRSSNRKEAKELAILVDNSLQFYIGLYQKQQEQQEKQQKQDKQGEQEQQEKQGEQEEPASKQKKKKLKTNLYVS